MKNKKLLLCGIVLLVSIFLYGCKHDDEPTYTVWTGSISFTEFNNICKPYGITFK